MKHAILLLFCILCCHSLLYGQSKTVQLSGLLKESDDSPVAFATVIAVSVTDSSLTYGCLSDSMGYFSLKLENAGNYRLSFEHIEYEKKELEQHFFADTNFGVIYLTPAAVVMETVYVYSGRTEHKGDRYIVDMKNNPIATSKTAHAVLNYMPGVTTDGEIKINGRTNTLVYIDDRLLTDLSELQAISADNIESIEVIPVAGSEYRINALGGVVKFKLRKLTETGIYGILSNEVAFAGDGFRQERVSSVVNIRHNKLNIYNYLFFDYDKSISEYDRTIQYLQSEATVRNLSDMESKRQGLGGTLSLVYDITPKHSIGANLEYRNVQQDSEAESEFESDLGSGMGYDRSVASGESLNNEYVATVDYKWLFGKSGSLFHLKADHTTSNSNLSGLNRYDVLPAQEFQIRNGDINVSSVTMVDAKTDFKINGSSNLQVGLMYVYSDIRNKLDYENFDGDSWATDEGVSDDFKNYGDGYGVYAFYSSRIKSFGFDLGLRYQYSTLLFKSIKNDSTVFKDYSFLYPSISLTYFFNQQKGNLINAVYKRALSFPNYTDYNPARTIHSDGSYSIGNPDLEPQKFDIAQLTYILNGKWNFSYSYIGITDAIRRITFVDPEDPTIRYDKPVNYGSEHQHRLIAGTQLTILKRLNVSAQIILGYAKVVNHVENYDFFNLGFNTSMSFDFGKGWSSSLGMNAYTKNRIGDVKLSGIFLMDFDVCKTVLNNKLEIRCGVENIFDRGYRRTVDVPNQLRTFSRDRATGRLYRIGISYKFGNRGKSDFKKIESNNYELAPPISDK